MKDTKLNHNNELNKFKNSKHFYNLINKLNLNKDNEFIDEILEIIKFELHEKNIILFKENQNHNLKLYLIWNGKIGICKFITKEYINNKKSINLDNFKWGFLLRELNEGDIFGELSLISDEKRRTASAYTIEKTFLLVIEKEHFKTKLKKFYKLDYELKKITLKNAFQNIPNYFLQIIAYKLKKLEFKRGHIILNKNDLITNLYIIIDGVIELYDKIENKHIFKTKFYNRIIYIKELSSNQIFGEEIIFYKKPKSKYYFKVKSLTASLYCINYSNLKNFPEIKNYFKKYLNNLWNYRDKSLKKKENKFIQKLIQINKYDIKIKNKSKNNKLKSFFQKNNKFIDLNLKEKKLKKIKNNISLLDNYNKFDLNNKKIPIKKNKSNNISMSNKLKKYISKNNLSLLKLKFIKRLN